jgi:hypothetical protein
MSKTCRQKHADDMTQVRALHDCEDCGAPSGDFHHREPATKLFSISNGDSYSEEKLLDEMDKCDTVCARCHNWRHYLGCLDGLRTYTAIGEDEVL